MTNRKTPGRRYRFRPSGPYNIVFRSLFARRVAVIIRETFRRSLIERFCFYFFFFPVVGFFFFCLFVYLIRPRRSGIHGPRPGTALAVVRAGGIRGFSYGFPYAVVLIVFAENPSAEIQIRHARTHV